MKTVEVKGEKFIVVYECAAKKFAGRSVKPYHKIYNSEATIKHGDTLLFVAHCEDAKFEDIGENVKAIAVGSGSIGVNGDDANEEKLNENNE